MQDLSIYDLLLTPIYILLILCVAYYIKKKHIAQHEEYKYYVAGISVKMLGAIGLGLIYFFYYNGGDTVNYYQTAKAYVNLFFKNRDNFMEGWLGTVIDTNHYYFFDENTGYPVYYHSDANAFFVVRLLIPLMAMGFCSYFATAVLTAAITYSGVWKLYQTFLKEYPMLRKELAIAVLFIPSCVFWGSGIMKDSFTFSAIGWFTYAFYHFFIQKQRRFKFAIQGVLSALVIICIKPYIFFALLPGAILWLSNQQIKKINHGVLRVLATPVLLGLGCLMGYLALYQMGDVLGMYKMDSVLERAVVVQKDMKAEYYGGKTFDIGEFDASATGIISKAPLAIFAGIFRPGIWDARNLVMFISSLENTYLLALTVFLLVKLKFLGFFSMIRKNPLLLFMMLFSLFFAFSVGLAVSNFGSLVRLRIPELPFFVGGLFIMRYLYEKQSGVKVRF